MKLTLTTIALLVCGILAAQSISINTKAVNEEQNQSSVAKWTDEDYLPYIVLGEKDAEPVLYDLRSYNRVGGQVGLGYIRTRSKGYIIATQYHKESATKDIFFDEVDERNRISGSPKKLLSGLWTENEPFKNEPYDTDVSGFFFNNDRSAFAYVFSDGKYESSGVKQHSITLFNDNCEKMWSKIFSLGDDQSYGINQLTVIDQKSIVLTVQNSKVEEINKKKVYSSHLEFHILTENKNIFGELNIKPGLTPGRYLVTGINETTALICGMYTDSKYYNNDNSSAWISKGLFTCVLNLTTGEISDYKYKTLSEELEKQLSKGYRTSKAGSEDAIGRVYPYSIQRSNEGRYVIVLQAGRYGIFIPLDRDFSPRNETFISAGQLEDIHNLGDKLAIIYMQDYTNPTHVLFVNMDGKIIEDKLPELPEKTRFLYFQWFSSDKASFRTFDKKAPLVNANSLGFISFKH